jgi:hypothetical protein
MARCLVSGSTVRTPSGETAVENIHAQALIITNRDGVESIEPVKWVGRREVDLTRHSHREAIAPVRIRAGAIAEGQPSRDLFVSPEHAIFLDDVLVEAKALINGGSIAQDRAMDTVTYHHIELESHGVFLANDLLVESYLDNGDRSFFDTDDQPTMLHPVLQSQSEFDARQSDIVFAPFMTDPETLAAVRQRLAQRSVALGYPRPALETTADPDIHIVAGGAVIQPISAADGQYVFELPAGIQSASLMSRFAIPADVASASADSRRLGIAVTSITIQSQVGTVTIPADFASDLPGWHNAERSEVAVWRWTDGAAVLPLDAADLPAVVTISAHCHAAYPIYDERICPAQKAAA